MPRKQIRHPENYSKAFPSRLRILMSDYNITQQALADRIGVSRQSVSCYCDGSTYPDWETIVEIADHFRVSADWLLGRSNVRSMDADLKTVCEVTGLSEIAVLNLYTAKRTETIEPIDCILKDSNFMAFMYDFSDIKKDWEEYDYKNKMTDEEFSEYMELQNRLDKYKCIVLTLNESIFHKIMLFCEYCIKDILRDYCFGKNKNEEEEYKTWPVLG